MSGTDRFYLDSNVIVAVLEASDRLTIHQRAFIDGIDKGRIEAVSSDITLSECLMRPIRERDAATLEAVLLFLDGRPTLPMVAAARGVMISAAKLRAETAMKLPDAIHIACALEACCTVFVSADKRLRMPASMRRIAFDDIELSTSAIE